VDDLRIAWLAGTDPLIGMTLTPGHPTQGAGGRVIPRDLDADLSRVARDAARLIVLLTDAELEAAGLNAIVERGLRVGLHVMRRPVIAAREVPGWLMTEITAWRRFGPTVYADSTGRGRSAIAAAWTLIAGGASVPDAVAAVRAARGLKALKSKAAEDRLVEFWREVHSHEPSESWLVPLPSAGLRRSHLPAPRAPWYWHLSEFALSFDGYGFAGGVDELRHFWTRQFEMFRATGDLAPGLALDPTRACLFFIQRIWHDRISDPTIGLDPGPTTDELLMAWALVERMRTLIDRP
jgi:hypothetical protein